MLPELLCKVRSLSSTIGQERWTYASVDWEIFNLSYITGQRILAPSITGKKGNCRRQSRLLTMALFDVVTPPMVSWLPQLFKRADVWRNFAQDCYHAWTLTLCFVYIKPMFCLSCCTPLWSGLPIYVVKSRTWKQFKDDFLKRLSAIKT